MTVIYSERDPSDPLDETGVDEYEREHAQLAADFSNKVIAAHREKMASDELERTRIRNALANMPVVHQLAEVLRTAGDDVLMVSGQQTSEEHEALRAQLDRGDG